MFSPRPFVQNAGPALWSGNFVLILAVSLFFGCSKRKPDRDRCLAAHKHNLELLAKNDAMPKEAKDFMLSSLKDPQKEKAMVESCLASKTMAQVRCELSATSFDDLKKCKPGD